MDVSANALLQGVFSAVREEQSITVTARERRLIDGLYWGYSDETLSQKQD
ncbi:hypothetical protein [Klebsiella oxytoca]|nr:hypothetical protein [Klebsiella oxytoca]EJM1003855.1 hypothetical protein [Klebsiella oxytoca]EKQ7238934.1 hypothetical protein [Klebsiella oxytoca]WBD78238.1 hypothetical protein OEE41_03935 [Klebsiella oxytoca]HBC8616427.1 hypothetical protein [Klebsiella oxytoca]